jgi:methionyl-tRNA formyltransferase
LSAPATIAFAGTPEFAVPSLRAIAASGARLTIVLTQPDRPAGRGRRLTPSPVKVAALDLGVPVLQPPTLRTADAVESLGSPPDLLVVVAYGLLLPRTVLAWPRLGCVNVHASLLPRWRGAAPIQHALLAGDATTGVSLMRMDEGLDTGPVYATRATPIGAAETAADLHDRLAEIGAALLAESLPTLLAGELHSVPQRQELATPAPKIAKADAALDWRRPAVELERRVRAFNPWPVAEAALADGRRLRVWQARAVDAGAAEPGAILAAGAAGIDVATGAGALRITRVQPPSTRAMDAAAYLAAHSVAGAKFVS